MAFFKSNYSDDQVKDYTGSTKYLNKSGMYEVIIKQVIVGTTANGSEYVNLWIDYEEQPQVLYQAMRLTNNDGSPNYGQQLFNKFLAVVTDGEDVEITEPVSKSLPVGKGGVEEECMVLEGLVDVPIILRLELEYSMYEGKIQENKIIRNFFRVTDKATASEIIKKADTVGKQYEQELEYAERVTYKDGLDEDDVNQWKKNRRGSKGKEEASSKPKAGFGQKRTFGRK